MDPRSPLARHQAALLGAVRALGVATDESLAAYLDSLGEVVDRTTLVRWRAGERSAPLGLLPVLLGHVDDPAAVLDILARPLGLRVVPDGDLTTDERGLGDRALELAEISGGVVSTVRHALVDGHVTDAEREDVRRAAADLRRAAAELESLANARRRAS